MWESLKGIWTKTSLTVKAGAAVAVMVACSLIYQWYKTPELPAGSVTQAPPAKAVEAVPKKEVPMTKLEVYDKTAVAKKVNLPDEVKSNPNKQVNSVSDVAPSKGGTTVTTVVDTETGKTTVYQEPKKVPLLGWGGEAKLGLGYGIGNHGVEENLHGEYQFVRVGKVYGSVRGEVNTRGDVKGTVNLDYQW